GCKKREKVQATEKSTNCRRRYKQPAEASDKSGKVAAKIIWTSMNKVTTIFIPMLIWDRMLFCFTATIRCGILYVTRFHCVKLPVHLLFTSKYLESDKSRWDRWKIQN